MTASGFIKANALVRSYEGGNVDDPTDPGGRTSRGITQRVYTAWLKTQGLQNRDVWYADEKQITQIYREQYWNAVWGDKLPLGVDVVVYDGAVNSGPEESVKWLQAALNAKRTSTNIPILIVDGHMGLVTMQAILANANNDALIEEILARRLAFLRRLKTWRKFGAGWSSRLQNLKQVGQALATGKRVEVPIEPAPTAPPPTGSIPQPIDNGAARATPQDIYEPPVSVGAGLSGVTASGTGAGLSDAVQQSANQFSMLSDVSSVFKWLFIVATLVLLGLTFYGVWQVMRNRQARRGQLRVDIPAEDSI